MFQMFRFPKKDCGSEVPYPWTPFSPCVVVWRCLRLQGGHIDPTNGPNQLGTLLSLGFVVDIVGSEKKTHKKEGPMTLLHTLHSFLHVVSLPDL